VRYRIAHAFAATTSGRGVPIQGYPLPLVLWNERVTKKILQNLWVQRSYMQNISDKGLVPSVTVLQEHAERASFAHISVIGTRSVVTVQV